MYLMILIDVSTGTYVGTLSAIDLDDGTLRYGSDFTEFFNVNETVSIYVRIINVIINILIEWNCYCSRYIRSGNKFNLPFHGSS